MGSVGSFPIRNLFLIVGDVINEAICRRLDAKEVHDVLFEMAPLKASRTD